MGTSVFWHSLLALDGAGRPLTAVITWADTRSAPAAAALRREHDERRIHARTGAPLHSAFFPAKLRWLRETRPEVFARAAVWCGFGEYLHARLTGHLAASLSMASGTGLLDQIAGGMGCRHAGRVRDRRRAAAAHRRHRRARPDRAARRALARARARALASGARGRRVLERRLRLPGPAAGRAQSRDVRRAPRHPARAAGPARGHAVGALALPGGRPRALVGGATSEGGNVLAWCRRHLALPGDPAALEAALGAAEPDGHGLTALPFLAGERSPGWRPEARAAVTGLSLDTGAVEIARALLESVAFRLAEVYDRPAPAGCRRSRRGGLRRGPGPLTGLGPDRERCPRRPGGHGGDAEASARGAALLALEALGVVVPEAPAPLRVLQPAPERHARYRAARERQRLLYDNIVGFNQSWKNSRCGTMRIAIGCDDTGLALKEPLVAALEADGHDVLDLGTFSTDPVDYPDYARAVGQAVLRGFVDASLLLCASGTAG